MPSPTRSRFTRARIRDELIRAARLKYGIRAKQVGMLDSEYLAILSTVVRRLHLKLDSFDSLGPNSTPDEAVKVLFHGFPRLRRARMPVPAQKRSPEERREAIRNRLLGIMSRRLRCDRDSIPMDLTLGEPFKTILADVVRLETGRQLKRFGSMHAGSTLSGAVDFLMSAIQA